MKLSRSELGIRMKASPDSIKAWEYGINIPRLPAFLSLCGWLGTEPNELCRTSDDDEAEYLAGLNYRKPATMPAEETT